MFIHTHKRAGTAGSVRVLRLLALAAAALSIPMTVFSLPARAEQVRSLQAMDFVALDGDRVLLTLTLSSAAPEPVVFTIDKPARLSLDLPDTSLALGERYRKVNVGLVRSIAAAEAKGRSRIVVELSQLTAHTVRVDGNKVFLELAGAGGTRTAAATPPASGAAAAPANASTAAAAAPPTQGLVSNIDFRRGEKGEGRVLVTLADARSAVDVREEGGKIIEIGRAHV